MGAERLPLDDYLRNRLRAAVAALPGKNQEEKGLIVGLGQKEVSRLMRGQRVVPPASLMDRVFREDGTSLIAVLAEYEGQAVRVSRDAAEVVRLWPRLPKAAREAVLVLVRGYRKKMVTHDVGDEAQ